MLGMLPSMHQRFILLSLLLIASSFQGLRADGNFYLKDGDRVVFYGDSITDQRLYTTFTETYVITRFPKMNVQFVHSGWGGDRVTGGGGGPIDLRLKRDVFAYKPTVMTIMLGMNDASYRAFDQGIFDTYVKGYEHIIKSVKSELPGIRITVIEPSPFDDVTQEPKFEGGYNAVLLRYGEFVKTLGQRENLNVADLNNPVVAALKKAKATDAKLAGKLVPDRVHPAPSGQLLMAAELIKSWNAPATVTEVQIDASNKSVVKTVSTKVGGAQFGGGVTWNQMDAALPMPVDTKDPAIVLAVQSSDFVEALNQQTLKVSGLSNARYTLNIDGTKVGSFSNEDLAHGINLATLPTPMTAQARKVHELTIRHNDMHFARWRNIQVPLETQKAPKVRKAIGNLITALDDEEASVIKQQRAAAKPVLHQYELRPE